jgi:uracil-DNA glycosylase
MCDEQFYRGWLIEQIPRQWVRLLWKQWNCKDFFLLSDWLADEYTTKTIFPAPESIFNTLRFCSMSPNYVDPLGDSILQQGEWASPKVIILGQDPYPGVHRFGSNEIPRANGYAFGVSPGIPPPESLKNIFAELKRDDKVILSIRSDGCLEGWAKQGVIALNSVLTVEKDKPNSHSNRGWENFTDGVIRTMSDSGNHLVFMLWGAHARKKSHLIDSQKHLILTTSHPSPNSVHMGFSGCGHFSKANLYLKEHGIPVIQW